MRVGLDQINQPPPLWFRRFVNALIIIVVPATVSLSYVFITDPTVREKISAVSVFVIALLKAFEYVIGDNSYTPPNLNEPAK